MAENGEIGTIIVKDLSRFGREQVEMGRLTQVVYPSLGIRFIAIQERVDTLTGDGVEMMPFHNISTNGMRRRPLRKIRAVWQSKAEHGERIASIVPYGYRNRKITQTMGNYEPAAHRKEDFCLCLAGKGPMQIARQLEEEQILSPAAYFESIGRKHAQKVPKNPCGGNRRPSAISSKTGSTPAAPSISKALPSVTKSIRESSTARKITKSSRHAGSHRLRGTMAEGAGTSQTQAQTDENRQDEPFFGLLYCCDCKSKMHFVASKSMKRKQEHFRCSQYKSGRGECSMHYIRDIVLEACAGSRQRLIRFCTLL